MPNVPLTCLNVHQRVGESLHTSAYVTVIRHSVTAPLATRRILERPHIYLYQMNTSLFSYINGLFVIYVFWLDKLTLQTVQMM